MSDVFLATDEHHVDFVMMLLDEARIAARLNHPNVIQTLDVGQEGDDYFLAMEYLDGQPVSRVLSSTSFGLPLGMHLSLIAEALGGLHYAHELKDYDGSPLHMVHRDVTPHNIFVTYTGQVKVMDFGIAKAAGRAAETRVGVVKGKVAYMAPEQILLQPVDRRADVYAAGVIL
jgi:eukaryotic-like serine/threonine-protein kinase